MSAEISHQRSITFSPAQEVPQPYIPGCSPENDPFSQRLWWRGWLSRRVISRIPWIRMAIRLWGLKMGTDSFIGIVDVTPVTYSGWRKGTCDSGPWGPSPWRDRTTQAYHRLSRADKRRFVTWASILKINNPGLRRSLRWAHQATEALTKIYKKGVRDISASNLLIDGESNVKLSDFQERLLKLDRDIVEDSLSVQSTDLFTFLLNPNYVD